MAGPPGRAAERPAGTGAAGIPGLRLPREAGGEIGRRILCTQEPEQLFPHFGVEGRGDVRHPLFPEDGARDSATDGAAAPAGRPVSRGLTGSRRARILGDERRRRLPVTLRREKSGRVGRGTSDSSVRGSHRAREGGGGGARGGRGGRKAHPGSGAICPGTSLG